MKTNNEYKMKGALMGASVLLAPLSVLAHESHENSANGSNALVTALTDDSASVSYTHLTLPTKA